uniref:Uncharacterized protein n=1 Tax=Mus musculus TaxID=10090 RepID=Q8CAZ0_MOUSE|nr:unnamed protein product [Mus musculus]
MISSSPFFLPSPLSPCLSPQASVPVPFCASLSSSLAWLCWTWVVCFAMILSELSAYCVLLSSLIVSLFSKFSAVSHIKSIPNNIMGWTRLGSALQSLYIHCLFACFCRLLSSSSSPLHPKIPRTKRFHDPRVHHIVKT